MLRPCKAPQACPNSAGNLVVPLTRSKFPAGLPDMTSSPRWLILSLGALLSATQATAAPPTVDPSDIAQRQVSLAGLDLSSPDGIARARQRISLAARQLCWGFGDSRKADDHENIRRCYDQALANALQQLDRRLELLSSRVP